jgi:hypothetical protein
VEVGWKWLRGATFLLSALACLVSPLAAQKERTHSPHGLLNIPCENCHIASAWRPIRPRPEFDHNKTNYPLRGMHEKVLCSSCHVKPVFTDVGKNCADCHADIHRRKFGPDCAQCHTVRGWQVSIQQIKDHQNRFPLFGAHAAVQCEDCHTGAAVGQYQGLSTLCSSCHLKDYQQTTNPNHAAAKFATACDSCHSFDSWLNAKFDHSSTGFLLTAGHANVPCAMCHINNNYNLQVAPTACGTSGCHLTMWQQTTNPPHPSAGPAFALNNCSNCHTTAGWDTANFDHSSTGFFLTAGHAKVACSACHINNNYNLQVAPSACGTSGCHLTTWQQTNNPVHSSSGPAFAVTNCSNCHTTAGWDSASFDHSATGFTLTGTHKSPSPTPCASCHVNNNYSLNSADCIGCHLSSWNSTPTLGGSVPDHIKAGFPTTAAACAQCHPITTWSAGTFDHTAFGFPLTNGHANVACASCHINNNYNLNISATACGTSGCHLTTWQQTNNPVHSTSGPAFAVGNCSTCHTTVGWDAASFNHSVTGFTLTGTHLSPTPTACAACHISNNYSLNSTDCMGCHVSSWNSTATLGGNVPNHITSGFPSTAAACASCHPITTWSAGTFDHSTTGFTLVGTHATTPCASCHVNGNYTLNSTNCYGCHITAWQSTATIGGNVPNHITAGFPTTAAQCASCHPITTWADGKFDHSTTGFALVGTHATTPCASCHINGNYTLNSTDCYLCHVTAWNSTTTLGGNVPNHPASGFPNTAAACATCHPITTWSAGTFNHSTTGFTLVGTHATTPCASCHVNGNYTLNSTDCYGCHITAWQSTATLGGAVPNHVANGFPSTAAQCASCHPITTWAAGMFDHSTTGFPLTGAHANPAVAPCSACHVNNNYSGTLPTDCYSCHLTAWQSTATLGGTVPNHIAAGFPTNCATSGCHTTTSWLGATFNHNTFWQLPHHGAVCSDCHIDSTNYANMSCINCHTQPNHSKTQTDSQHKGRSGYTYGPMTCIASGCHLKGP